MASFNRIGTTLGGRYQIQELLGQGGMSSVYKALDPNLQRIVAVKMIHPHMSGDPKFSARFEDEARAVARLRHPNIVQVFDFNHDEDVFYMVQEYLPGESLQAMLHRYQLSGEKLSPEEAIRFTMGICSAIDYAHKLGMIHRDIKPANIMIDERGQAILMDFGIVKLQSGDSHTTTGTIVGTIAYMPPDLIRGDPPEPRSDIYSLGVTLFEMLTGQLPFHSDSAITLMMMVQNNPVPDLHQLRTDIPEDLVAIIKKSLAKNREDRFRTAGEMGTALNRVLDSIQNGDASCRYAARQHPGAGKAQSCAVEILSAGAKLAGARSSCPDRFSDFQRQPGLPDRRIKVRDRCAGRQPNDRIRRSGSRTCTAKSSKRSWIRSKSRYLDWCRSFPGRSAPQRQGLFSAGRLEISESRKGETTQPARRSQYLHLQLLLPRQSAAVVLPTATTAPAMVVAVPTENHSMETSPLETPQLAPTSMAISQRSASPSPSISLLSSSVRFRSTIRTATWSILRF